MFIGEVVQSGSSIVCMQVRVCVFVRVFVCMCVCRLTRAGDDAFRESPLYACPFYTVAFHFMSTPGSDHVSVQVVYVCVFVCELCASVCMCVCVY